LGSDYEIEDPPSPIKTVKKKTTKKKLMRGGNGKSQLKKKKGKAQAKGKPAIKGKINVPAPQKSNLTS
jgi:hypothetical protein